MKIAILGILIGTGIFTSGFIHHDINYDSDLSWNDDTHENVAYLVGTAGVIITTVAVKHLLNQYKPKVPKELRPLSKFRMTLQLLIGLGLWESGLWLHEMGELDDQINIIYYDGNMYRHKDRDDIREHLGYFVGAYGTTLFTLSAYQMLSAKGPPKPAQDLDHAFGAFRAGLNRPSLNDPKTWSKALSQANR